MPARVSRCRFKALVLLLLSGFILSACVHTETGGFSEKKDDKKALTYSEELARGYIREGNWEAAKRHLKVALDMDESSAGAYEGLAMVYQNTGEYEQAAVNYEKAVRLEPDTSRIRLNYASFLYQQGEYNKAVQELEIVTEDTLYPKREVAFVNLGRCYMKLENPEGAQKAFMRAYLMDRRSPGIKLELADAYIQLGNFSEAQKFYDAFREQVSSQSPRALWLGAQLAAEYDDRDALASFGLALKNLYPKSNEYLQYKRQYENE